MPELAQQPFLRVIPDLAPKDLHTAVWKACTEKRWYFGHVSITEGGQPGIPFWKMDLEDDAAVSRLWERSKAACEKATGRRLGVARQYANGHTYGLGGQPHVDDTREGCYTLLYYPMPSWQPEWEGETLFYNARGEVIAGVKPAPNRAVLFDSRIPHSGRAPSRLCAALRVTVAFKLEPPA
jgi:hypothetical protein